MIGSRGNWMEIERSSLRETPAEKRVQAMALLMSYLAKDYVIHLRLSCGPFKQYAGRSKRMVQ